MTQFPLFPPSISHEVMGPDAMIFIFWMLSYIVRNARLDEAQAIIQLVGRNINNLRYVDDTTLMAESKELNSFLMKMNEESENFGLKLDIQKTKIMASSPITSRQIDGETMET